MKTNFIFVTGGVYSSLGKGITASSIGCILKQLGFSVTMQKLDPYLNIDPMFISPLQHGEVFITSDGAKADLDLGNYERFIDYDLNMYSTVTSGRIYFEVLNKERHGFYGGKTIQVVPHITNQVISKLEKLAETNQTDFAIVEIGGTIGDMESLPFIQAISEFSLAYKSNTLFAHCVPLITIPSVYGELKTKPAQHSVKTLRSLGISPDLLLLRSSVKIDSETLYKLSWSTGVKEKNIFECMDLQSTYFMPEELYKQGIHKLILEHFNIDKFTDNFSEWTKFTDTIKSKKTKKINVAIVGEYIDLHDAYFSVCSSLNLSAYKLSLDLNLNWIQVANLDLNNLSNIFKGIDAIIVTPCDDEHNNIINRQLLKWLENQNIATLAYGNAFENVIINNIKDLPKNMYGDNDDALFILDNECNVGSRLTKSNDAELIDYYNKKDIVERHFHKYEFNKNFINRISNNLDLIGFNTDNKFLDFIRIKNHKFYYTSYANIEFTSKPNKPNPIYLNLLKSGVK